MQVKRLILGSFCCIEDRLAWGSTTTSVLFAVFSKVDRVEHVFQVLPTINTTGMSNYFVQDMFYFRVTEFNVQQVRIHIFEIHY